MTKFYGDQYKDGWNAAIDNLEERLLDEFSRWKGRELSVEIVIAWFPKLFEAVRK